MAFVISRIVKLGIKQNANSFNLNLKFRSNGNCSTKFLICSKELKTKAFLGNGCQPEVRSFPS